MKYGLNEDGRKCGPIDPEKINDDGWTWYDTESERDAAVPVDWLREIATRREEKLDSSLTVTLSDGDHKIPVSDRALSLAPVAARHARADGSTRPFPIDGRTSERDADDLDAIEAALDAYATAVWRREAELQAMVDDGSITESDLSEGWPE